MRTRSCVAVVACLLWSLSSCDGIALGATNGDTSGWRGAVSSSAVCARRMLHPMHRCSGTLSTTVRLNGAGAFLNIMVGRIHLRHWAVRRRSHTRAGTRIRCGRGAGDPLRAQTTVEGAESGGLSGPPGWADRATTKRTGPLRELAAVPLAARCGRFFGAGGRCTCQAQNRVEVALGLRVWI